MALCNSDEFKHHTVIASCAGEGIRTWEGVRRGVDAESGGSVRKGCQKGREEKSRGLETCMPEAFVRVSAKKHV